jgi:hypothetical protein
VRDYGFCALAGGLPKTEIAENRRLTRPGLSDGHNFDVVYGEGHGISHEEKARALKKVNVRDSILVKVTYLGFSRVAISHRRAKCCSCRIGDRSHREPSDRTTCGGRGQAASGRNALSINGATNE